MSLYTYVTIDYRHQNDTGAESSDSHKVHKYNIHVHKYEI